MKAEPQCRECLARLVRQAAALATGDENLRAEAVSAALLALEEAFPTSQLTIAVSTRLHEVVRAVTGNPDPYRRMKDAEMAVARDLVREIAPEGRPSIADGVRLAVVGNLIDFFRPLEEAKAQMRQPVQFTLDDTTQFEERLRRASEVLFLADNAGEVYFDLPLLDRMREFARVVYVMKPSPVQNDLTLEDIARAGLQERVGETMTTGAATPGIVLSQASAEFRRAFDAADLILAKGMGYYEALSELPPTGRVFHCLVAKCEPVARSLGVAPGSFVATLR